LFRRVRYLETKTHQNQNFPNDAPASKKSASKKSEMKK